MQDLFEVVKKYIQGPKNFLKSSKKAQPFKNSLKKIFGTRKKFLKNLKASEVVKHSERPRKF